MNLLILVVDFILSFLGVFFRSFRFMLFFKFVFGVKIVKRVESFRMLLVVEVVELVSRIIFFF